MNNVWENLKYVKKAIKELHSHHYSQAHKKVDELRIQLAAVQQDPTVNESEELHLREKENIEDQRHCSQVEESILQQKSRINWLSLGDSNSKFFFTAVKIRKARNNLTLIQNDLGDIIPSLEGIQKEMVKF